VLVSTATAVPLFVGSHPDIEHRQGALPAVELQALIRERGIRAIVNATHPYASHIRATAPRVAEAEGIAYLNYLRPGLGAIGEGVFIAEDHESAARLAFESRSPVLLTIGSRNVLPYGMEAARTGTIVVARVLDHPDSLCACQQAGIPQDRVIIGRGPFSIEANRSLIRQFHIGALVTKDSGEAGGVREKLEAARLEGCKVVVVGRPSQPEGAIADLTQLMEELQTKLQNGRS
jgi:precorrin-6A/cobalt-precorrin-6A reductase